VHDLHQTYHRLSNHFGRTQWYSLVIRLKRKLVLIHLETILILTQDKCTVGTKRTIGSEIILDIPSGTPSDKAQVEAHFGPFGDNANLDAR
jgi:hypothetical protein